ncbi:high mobility group B protein 14 [Cocos nucifera]|uniref:High mobility group B protein 14 n=1 Tax=Cocos nucifera TaxID=13894 RepID=A0A8K0IUQ4_COCNU|nr:high mobility group B protein 14 [Cocos nucifera]
MKTRAKQAKPGEKPTNPKALAKKPIKPKAKKRPAKDDARKPKKPPTAFFYYLEDFRKTFQQENPDVKSMRDIGKACGEKWKTMSFEEGKEDKIIGRISDRNAFCGKMVKGKVDICDLNRIINVDWNGLEKVQYYDIATEKRAEFEKAMAEYMKKKESGELSEESDDEDE